MITSTEVSRTIQSQVGARVLREGYGPGAWHGPDLKEALSSVTPTAAFWRPGEGRHNIAEIALHHAYYTRAVRAQIAGSDVEPFVLDGQDWFPLADDRTLAWPKIQDVVAVEQDRLTRLVADVDRGAVVSPLSDGELFGLVLGITCHAVYHAGQIQLIKRLQGA